MQSTSSAAWQPVAISMGVAAAYDLAFAIAMLFFPGRAALLLGLPPPPDPTYLGLAGLLLTLLAGMYALAAADVVRYRGIVRVAIVGRFLGAVYLAHAASTHGMAPAFVAAAAADLAFAVVHGVLFHRARRVGTTQVPEDSRA